MVARAKVDVFRGFEDKSEDFVEESKPLKAIPCERFGFDGPEIVKEAIARDVKCAIRKKGDGLRYAILSAHRCSQQQHSQGRRHWGRLPTVRTPKMQKSQIDCASFTVHTVGGRDAGRLRTC